MNIDKLKSLLGNDENMVNKFLEIFKNETPNQLAKLNEAIEEKNWPQVSILAHGIKSQVKYLDLKEIASLAYDIEESAEKEEDLEHMNMFYFQLDEALMKVIKML